MHPAVPVLHLPPQALQDIVDVVTDRVAEGLAAPGREIAALPAWLPPPPPGTRGRALVVDTGGTNMRAAVLDLADGGARVVAGPVSAAVPSGRDGVPVAGDTFFAAQADLVASLSPPPGLPVGYCFSYPARVDPDGDATLLRWTKGLRIDGVEGTKVGTRLRTALADRGLAPGPVRVLNDTVAALMGGAWAWADQGLAGTIGLIVGTGTNMALFLPVDRIPKLGGRAPAGTWMAVNLESGALHPPHLTEWDERVDDASENPGAQRFEKAVSGFYLPRVYREVLPEGPALDPEQASADLVRYRDAGEDATARAVAAAVLDRSADLVAAGLAGLAAHFPPGPAGPGPFGVVAEGSLFWKTPGYAERVRGTLGRLVGDPSRPRVGAVDHANLVGAAAAARVALPWGAGES